MYDLISRRAIIDVIKAERDKSTTPKEWHDGMNMAIFCLIHSPSAQLAELDIWGDGTLRISVSKGQLGKIGRVLVIEDGTIFCKQFYQNAEPERKKGTWTDDASCPFCGFKPWYERDIHTLSFCPNCGADMRGECDEKI